ncbi:hypothetical protein QTP88_009673 [Uroleucon formosanum]
MQSNSTKSKQAKTVQPIKIINNQVINNALPLSSPEWQQQQKPSKRNLPCSPNSPINIQEKKSKFFSSPNRFSVLSEHEPDTIDNDDTNNSNEPEITQINKKDQPPPIYVKGILNFSNLRNAIGDLIGQDNFTCKSTTTHLKIQPDTPNNYRTLIHFLKDEKAEYHTFQSQSDKSLRAVIKNIHHTTEPTEITSALEEIGFTVRQVTNIKHQKTKKALPLFFVDLAPETIIQKRRARCLWQRTKYPADKCHYNALAQNLKRILANYRNESYTKHLKSLTTKDCSLWKATKQLLRVHNPPAILRDASGNWVYSDMDKANIFANHLADTFQPHNTILLPEKINEVEQFLDIPLQMSLPPKHLSPAEVKYTISKFPRKKSPGYDLITAEVLNQLPKKVIILLTYIYNSMLRLSYFPLLWKYSSVILILKPKKPPDCPSSYRPISLLPILSKVFEKMLLKKLTKTVEETKALPDSQFGFRSKHSTIHQIHRLVDKISFSLEEKQYCTGAFLDVSQAFDRVWHAGLLFKLKLILPASYYLILKSYLEDRFFSVRYGSSTSPPKPINAGVPQGAVTAPLLFNIFISDQPTIPTSLVGDFADDKAIITNNTDPITASLDIQEHLSLLEQWYKEWGVKINESKSIHCTFTLRKEKCPPIILNEQILPITPCIRYLGITIDQRLTWAPHIRNKLLTLNDRFRLLRSLLTSHHIKLSTKLLIYKLFLKPIWTYGIQLWGSAKPTNVNRIQRFQSKVLRAITKAPFYVSNHTLHNDLTISPVNDVAKTFYRRFNFNLQNHKNPLIKELASINIPGNPQKRLKRRWCRDLLV